METQHGIVVHTHKLEPDAEVYAPTGQFEEMIKVDEPWEIEVAIDAITPRLYRPGG